MEKIYVPRKKKQKANKKSIELVSPNGLWNVSPGDVKVFTSPVDNNGSHFAYSCSECRKLRFADETQCVHSLAVMMFLESERIQVIKPGERKPNE